MKVAELIRRLQAADPNASVVLSGFDHSYRSIDYAGNVAAEKHDRGDDREFSEYHGREHMSDKTNGVVDVFLIN